MTTQSEPAFSSIELPSALSHPRKVDAQSKGSHLAERSYGAFERSLQLPDSVDETKVDAKFDKGVLKITATKKPEAVKAQRKIEIKTAS